ncbi:hypothetical protein BKA61DRAFT_716983 [Leptodontidium sp. MPI-SDFR-AT-0119]|nr:hypothetical protein BKA61DRAFT_716983 [Leptodontidium sp. MPI-SDFR-AT-0119]
MADLLSVLSQYTILTGTAQYLSTLDIFHLALANSDCYSMILQSPRVFNHLKLTALCDGRGLAQRQEFYSIYSGLDFTQDAAKRKPKYEEEIEVRVWNRKCDAECRFVPRVRDTNGRSYRRPHISINPWFIITNVICYCTACDVNVEASLPLSLSEYCDCDQYTRWICLKCKLEEEKIHGLYRQKRTQPSREYWQSDPDMDRGRCLQSHGLLAYWCPCGKRPPVDSNVRCAWCKRRHNLKTWMDEQLSNYIPAFDDDPDRATTRVVWSVLFDDRREG